MRDSKYRDNELKEFREGGEREINKTDDGETQPRKTEKTQEEKEAEEDPAGVRGKGEPSGENNLPCAE